MEVSQEVRPVRRRDQGDVMCRGLQPRARVAVHVGVQYEVTEIVVLMIMMYITISAISAKLEKGDEKTQQGLFDSQYRWVQSSDRNFKA